MRCVLTRCGESLVSEIRPGDSFSIFSNNREYVDVSEIFDDHAELFHSLNMESVEYVLRLREMWCERGGSEISTGLKSDLGPVKIWTRHYRNFNAMEICSTRFDKR